MRYKQKPYVLYERSMPSGSTVFYYYSYDRDGNKTPSKSTGIGYSRDKDKAKKRKEADSYLWSLFEAGELTEGRNKPTLKGWVDKKHFFDWYKSDYVRSKLRRSDKGKAKITRGYIETGKKVFDKHIAPYHGSKYIDEITPAHCEELLFRWVDDGYTHKTANNFRSYYSIIMREAKRLDVIQYNPWDNVPGLSVESEKKGAFTAGEVKQLLDGAHRKDNRDRVYYYAMKVAFFTGMRIGEIVGLQTDDIIDAHIERDNDRIDYSYIRVTCQWSMKEKKLVPVKDKEPRDIPITPELREELQQFLTGSGRFLFSHHPRQETPITANRLRDWLYRQMEALGIDRMDERGRIKTFHSSRRFLNTLLRLQHVDGELIRKLTGHDSDAMTEHYTDYMPGDLTVIADAQKLIDKK